VTTAALPPAAFGAALAALPGIGPQQLRVLLDDCDPAEAWQRVASSHAEVAERYPKVAGRWFAAARSFDVEAWWERCTADGRQVFVLGSDGYPPALAADHAAPAVLFAAGDAEAIEGRARVAVVGTRRCTASGSETAERLGRELSEAGVAVVSGLALGIDGAAHRGALSSSGGRSAVGVVGSGLDVPYPTQHRRLWRDVATHGVLLSEVAPGGRPEAWRFPARNRVIAALAHAVVVVESHATGGAMLTVEQAAMRSRDVLVVPGAPASPASAGTNALLIEGAIPVRDAADVLAHLSIGCPEPVTAMLPSTAEPEVPAETAADPVLACVDFAPTSTEKILDRCRMAPAEVSLALHRLEVAGCVRAAAPGWWERLR
jgi:DNA processing protein